MWTLERSIIFFYFLKHNWFALTIMSQVIQHWAYVFKGKQSPSLHVFSPPLSKEILNLRCIWLGQKPKINCIFTGLKYYLFQTKLINIINYIICDRMYIPCIITLLVMALVSAHNSMVNNNGFLLTDGWLHLNWTFCNNRQPGVLLFISEWPQQTITNLESPIKQY